MLRVHQRRAILRRYSTKRPGIYIGGYQVCEKWLKDRKGRKLSSDDIDHYQKIVVALAETIRIMAEIDSLVRGLL